MFLSSEICYTLNYLSESKATFSKVSIYGQGQGHRSNKSAQNVSFFSYLRLFVLNCLCKCHLGGFQSWGAYCFWVVRPFVTLFDALPYLLNHACFGFEISYMNSS